tara:strand:- start:340 stop:786 length:447 start_codon:yes stop_codon:yes gene_type:complete
MKNATLAEFNNPAWQETTLQEVLNTITDSNQANLEMVPFFSDYLAKHCTDLDTQKWLVYDTERYCSAVQEHHTAMITGKKDWINITEQTLGNIWAKGSTDWDGNPHEHTQSTHRIEVLDYKGRLIHCFAQHVNEPLTSACCTYFVKAQ